MEFKGSKTEKNLMTAFSGEAQAHMKYKLFAEKAKAEGYEQIAEIFKYTAENELEHGKLWFKALGYLSNTQDNLTAAISGEHFEHTKMYKEFAEEALVEGFAEISGLFKSVAEIEHHHEDRYSALLDNIKDDKVFSKDEIVLWQCRSCGHIHEGKDAPEKCPVCKKSQSYFQIYPENY